MLNIQKFVCNMIRENCYVVSDETRECVIIDCGAYYEEERRAIVDYIRKENLKPKHLLATHAHIDHNFGNNTVYEAFGLKPEVEGADEKLMEKLPLQAQAIAGVTLDYKMPTRYTLAATPSPSSTHRDTPRAACSTTARRRKWHSAETLSSAAASGAPTSREATRS